MSEVLHVVAELSFAPEARRAFLDAFRRLEPLVRAEEGCVEYRGVLEARTGIAAQTEPRGEVLMVIEKWSSESALRAHLEAPHMVAFGEETRGMMTGRVIRVARGI